MNTPTHSLPAGWNIYTPPEGDFSVAVPLDPSTVKMLDYEAQKVRTYMFRYRETAFAVVLLLDRIERVGRRRPIDTPEAIRADPTTIAGSVRDIVLGDLQGLEYRSVDEDEGERLHHFYASSDRSTVIGLRVIRPKHLSDDEIHAFFDSFQFKR